MGLSYRQALRRTQEALSAAGVPDPALDAEWLMVYVTGMDRLRLRLEGARTLSPSAEAQLATLTQRRCQRQPLQYLLGTQAFYGLELRVDSRALIPRQETETLCETGLEHLQALLQSGTSAPAALDLCTGSGALAIAIQRLCPTARVTATDLSRDALALARENASALGAQVRFLQGDLFLPVSGERFDLILSNPPYVPTDQCATLQAEVRCEPLMALDGGTDGLDFYRRIAAQAPAHLKPGGLLAVEVGDGQAPAVAALFSALGHVRVRQDLYGQTRVVAVSASRM